MQYPFEKFNLKPFLLEAIEKIGFKEPTEVQEKLIPEIKKGRSVIGQSQTGTGKTHTFLLPLIDNIDSEKAEVQVVITAPSRELATQLFEAAEQLTAHTDLSVQNYVGGTDKSRQLSKLEHKQPHLVIGTPGRILDLVNEGGLLLHTATVLVVDEADMTLDMGFLEDVDKIASKLPSSLQMLVFSATIPQSLQPFLKKYMNNPLFEQINAKTILSPTLENWLISTQGKEKIDIIYQLLTIGQPYLAIVFANTKAKVDEITAGLKKRGLKVATVHGDIPPRERKRVMKQIQNLDYQFIVATDLASRGIDIEGVSHVINAEIPNDLDFFIHRVGRTGRKGMKGIAITLYEPSEGNKIAEIEKLGISFEPKQIKKNEIVDTYDRNRREKREKTGTGTLDPTIRGMVKKKKKNIKPGYNKKIDRAIQESNRKKRLKESKNRGQR
ncbi:MAG: DEAD/DEAH box helicase [Pisciglobus halotolerans]|nr:DEAD/DEAH box helicase [Pisciglobus halotolerans]